MPSRMVGNRHQTAWEDDFLGGERCKHLALSTKERIHAMAQAVLTYYCVKKDLPPPKLDPMKLNTKQAAPIS